MPRHVLGNHGIALALATHALAMACLGSHGVALAAHALAWAAHAFYKTANISAEVYVLYFGTEIDVSTPSMPMAELGANNR